jgi:hypothetical protein
MSTSTRAAMTQRSPISVFLLPLITFGIYSIVWCVKTRGELISNGAVIPTSWLLIVPVANIYYLWVLAAGIEKVTRSSAMENFILMLLLGSIGQAIVQSRMNNA